MIDITHKSTTLREATAQAVVKASDIATINAIKDNKVPKGNVIYLSDTSGVGHKRLLSLMKKHHPFLFGVWFLSSFQYMYDSLVSYA